MSRRGARERAAINKRNPCSVPGCVRRRNWLSLQCNNHAIKQARYGHVRGRAVAKQEWSPYFTEIHALLAKNEDHVGLREAEAIMAEILNPGPERKKKRNGPGAAEYHRQVELARLRQAGITPRVVLETALAVWMLAREQPGTLPDDDRLTHAMANAIYKLAPYRCHVYWDGEKKHVDSFYPGGGACSLLGHGIRSRLVSFAVQVEAALRAQKHEENQRLAAMKTPLSIKPVATKLPKLGPRPVYRTTADLPALRTWERLARLHQEAQQEKSNHAA